MLLKKQAFKYHRIISVNEVYKNNFDKSPIHLMQYVFNKKILLITDFILIIF